MEKTMPSFMSAGQEITAKIGAFWLIFCINETERFVYICILRNLAHFMESISVQKCQML